MNRTALVTLSLWVLLLAGCQRPPKAEPPADEFEDVLQGNDGGSRELPTPVTGPVVNGTVSAVDSELGIVILTVGSDDGVEVGTVFTVYRGDEYVARVAVDRVEADWCSADVVRKLTKSTIRVGDLVSTGL